MFDRFTLQTFQVLVSARAAVTQLGSSAVEPEHILLGLLETADGVGGRILAHSGLAPDNIRADILARLGGGARISDPDEIPFSASCQRALDYAAEEADRLSHNSIGTEHLLLGLLREEPSVAAEVLTSRGLRIEAVREAIVESLGRGGQVESPAPPPTPANTYQWPHIPFVPSRTVHILRSGMRWPETPVINFPGTVFSAYGFTLEEIIVRASEGSRWYVDIPANLRDDARFDFLMVLPEQETRGACLGLLRAAIEQQFGVHVQRAIRTCDVYRLTKSNSDGPMRRRYADPQPGTGFSSVEFSVFRGRPKDEPMFPLDPFAVHSVPLMFLVQWFEEILGGQVIDETDLPGIYGFELKERVDTPAAFIQLLRDEAGLVLTREPREVPTLVVRAAI
jgi:uncharacterized protein (TIGR03435 family)